MTPFKGTNRKMCIRDRYFLEAILNDKVVYPTYYASGSIPATVVAMLRQYKDDIPLLAVANAPAEQADETSWQETGGQLVDVAYTKLQTVQHSQRCRYDYAASTITAEVLSLIHISLFLKLLYH